MADSIRAEILQEAESIVTSDRNAAYGDPESNFGMIAEFWGIYLNTKILPHQVAAMMALMKIARITTSPEKIDHWVDLAGYAACGGEVRDLV